MALPFAHLRGRSMWAHCDHDGTRIDGEPAGVRLAPMPLPPNEAAPGTERDLFREKAWEERRGAAVRVPLGPVACEEAQTLLLDPQAGLLALDPQGWHPPQTAGPFAGSVGPTIEAGPVPRFQSVLPDPQPPERPAGLALDPWQGIWLLDRPAGALRRLNAAGRVIASVALPKGCQPVRFGCSALGVLLAEQGAGGREPALLFRPWQGEWRGLRLALEPEPPPSEAGGSRTAAKPGATGGAVREPKPVPELIDLAADPAISWAVALIREGHRHGLVVWDGRRWRRWLAPTLRRPRHVLIDGPESVLVSEPLWLPDDSRALPFTRLLLRPAGPEAEESFSVRGFDGRALWRDGDTLWASTAFGARALLRKEPRLRGEGRIETRALDSGCHACHWHRLFVDVCLPPGTGLWVEARSADDLPPLEVRRDPRKPWDLRDQADDAAPVPGLADGKDPWPPLASRDVDDKEGWQRLAMADRRPPLIDQPLDQPEPGQAGMETLEWLVNAPPGRYLWLRLHLEGDGLRSPVVHALRVSQPRPALLERLPGFWRVDPEGAALSERFLALFEGPITELDHRAEALSRLFLPALAPAEALPWLAGFLALSFHDQLPPRVRRRLLAEIAGLHRQRGTRPGLERLLSILAETDVVILEGFRLRRRTAAFVGEPSVVGPALELGGRQGLGEGEPDDWRTLDPLILATSGEDEARMALAHRLLLDTRDSELAAGRAPCPSEDPPSPMAADPLRAWYRQQAHRFTVLIPLSRTTVLEGVLEQALEWHKPAHTSHQLCWIEAGACLDRGVRVGLHRLGLSPRAAPPVLGQALLGGGTEPLGGAGSSQPRGPDLAVMPFLPMRSRQP